MIEYSEDGVRLLLEMCSKTNLCLKSINLLNRLSEYYLLGKKGKIERGKCIPKKVKDERCMCKMIFPKFVALNYNIMKL